MSAIVTSDVHLGSGSLDVQPFMSFLEDFPSGKRLILNGDIVNRNCGELPQSHTEALDELRRLSERTHVTWIRGNHDEDYLLPDPNGIELEDFCLVHDGVAILHGHDFRHRHISNPPLVWVLRAIQRVRKHMAAESANARYRVWEGHILVRILRRHIIANAFALAKEKGFRAVVCGHIHIPEKIERSGATYINTGSWLRRADPNYAPVCSI